jgi:hypothetical protein
LLFSLERCSLKKYAYSKVTGATPLNLVAEVLISSWDYRVKESTLAACISVDKI